MNNLKPELSKIISSIETFHIEPFAFRKISRVDSFPLFQASQNELFNKNLLWNPPQNEQALITDVDKLIYEMTTQSSLTYSLILKTTGQWAGLCKLTPYLDGLAITLWIHPLFWKTKAALIGIDSLLFFVFNKTHISTVYAKTLPSNTLMKRIISKKHGNHIHNEFLTHQDGRSLEFEVFSLPKEQYKPTVFSVIHY